jgi:tetratricopeptide (TPR) repeat protein
MQRWKLLVCVPLLLVVGACNRDPHAKAVRYVENGNKFFEKEKYKEASIMYRRAVAANADPKYGEAYYRLGLTALKLGSPTDAYQAFLRAVELQPQNADALAKIADIEVVASAANKANEKLLDEAATHANSLVQLKDGAYDGNRLLGQIALLRKDSSKAIEYFEKANQLKPDQAPLLLAYFQALAENGQPERAEAVAKDLISKQKTYAPAYDLLYLQYVTKGRLADGEQLLRLKVDNNPTNEQHVMQLAAHYAATRQAEKVDETLRRLDDPKYLQGYLSAGDFYYLRLREFAKAQEQYEGGLKAFPKEAATYQKRLVELYAASNRIPEANKLLAKVLEADPKDPEAISMRASLHLASGNRDEINLAVNDLQGLVNKTPNNHLLHFNLGRALLAKGEIEQARVQFDEVLKLRQDFLAARETLARIYLSRNNGAKALEEADKIVRQDPNNLEGHLRRSDALLMLGEWDKAREELNFTTSRFPQSTHAQYQVGLLAYQSKDYTKAAQVFGDIRKSNPKDVKGLVGMVETLASQNQMAQAIREMEAAASAEPDRRDLSVFLANLYVRSERYDEAIQRYKAVVAKDPKAADILFKLAETYRRKGDLNEAIDTFKKASQAAPNDATPLLQLGLLMDGTGRREQSKPIYESILRIEQDPKRRAIALNNLAYIKAEEGTDLDAALSMAQQAVQAMPDSEDIADTLGWVYIKKNLSVEAIRIFKGLVDKRPENPMYRMHYGMALIQTGDKPAARRELEAALRNRPSKDEANRINDLLRKL